MRSVVEIQLLAVPATSWPEAVAKARYVLNLYSAGPPPTDTHHRDLVTAVLADLTRLGGNSDQVNAQSGSFPPRSNGPTVSIRCKISRLVTSKKKNRFVSG